MALPYRNICIWVIDLKLRQFGNHIGEGNAKLMGWKSMLSSQTTT